MIIDCNAHLGHWPFRDLQYSSADDFVNLMNSNGITQAVVAPYQGLLYGDVRPANEWLLEEVSSHGERFIPLAAINPAFPAWEGDLRRAIDRGFSGVAIYPNYHSYTLEDQCARDLFDALADEGLFVRVHVRMQDERLHHPVCGVAPVDISTLPQRAAEVPSVGVLIANATNAEWPAISEALRTTDNFFMDISHVERVGGMSLLAEDVGVGSVAFGTHASLQYAQAAVLKIREAGLQEQHRQRILHENASAWMNG